MATAGEAKLAAVCSGTLKKAGKTSHTFRPRWCVLSKDSLAWFKSELADSQSQGSIPLTGAVLRQHAPASISPPEFAFTVGARQPPREYYFACNTAESLEQWSAAIQQVMDALAEPKSQSAAASIYASARATGTEYDEDAFGEDEPAPSQADAAPDAEPAGWSTTPFATDTSVPVSSSTVLPLTAHPPSSNPEPAPPAPPAEAEATPAAAAAASPSTSRRSSLLGVATIAHALKKAATDRCRFVVSWMPPPEAIAVLSSSPSFGPMAAIPPRELRMSVMASKQATASAKKITEAAGKKLGIAAEHLPGLQLWAAFQCSNTGRAVVDAAIISGEVTDAHPAGEPISPTARGASFGLHPGCKLYLHHPALGDVPRMHQDLIDPINMPTATPRATPKPSPVAATAVSEAQPQVAVAVPVPEPEHLVRSSAQVTLDEAPLNRHDSATADHLADDTKHGVIMQVTEPEADEEAASQKEAPAPAPAPAPSSPGPIPAVPHSSADFMSRRLHLKTLFDSAKRVSGMAIRDEAGTSDIAVDSDVFFDELNADATAAEWGGIEDLRAALHSEVGSGAGQGAIRWQDIVRGHASVREVMSGSGPGEDNRAHGDVIAATEAGEDNRAHGDVIAATEAGESRKSDSKKKHNKTNSAEESEEEEDKEEDSDARAAITGGLHATSASGPVVSDRLKAALVSAAKSLTAARSEPEADDVIEQACSLTMTVRLTPDVGGSIPVAPYDDVTSLVNEFFQSCVDDASAAAHAEADASGDTQAVHIETPFDSIDAMDEEFGDEMRDAVRKVLVDSTAALVRAVRTQRDSSLSALSAVVTAAQQSGIDLGLLAPIMHPDADAVPAVLSTGVLGTTTSDLASLTAARTEAAALSAELQQTRSQLQGSELKQESLHRELEATRAALAAGGAKPVSEGAGNDDDDAAADSSEAELEALRAQLSQARDALEEARTRATAAEAEAEAARERYEWESNVAGSAGLKHDSVGDIESKVEEETAADDGVAAEATATSSSDGAVLTRNEWRAWAEEKRQILSRANKDRAALAEENRRLREAQTPQAATLEARFRRADEARNTLEGELASITAGRSRAEEELRGVYRQWDADGQAWAGERRRLQEQVEALAIAAAQAAAEGAATAAQAAGIGSADAAADEIRRLLQDKASLLRSWSSESQVLVTAWREDRRGVGEGAERVRRRVTRVAHECRASLDAATRAAAIGSGSMPDAASLAGANTLLYRAVEDAAAAAEAVRREIDSWGVAAAAGSMAGAASTLKQQLRTAGVDETASMALGHLSSSSLRPTGRGSSSDASSASASAATPISSSSRAGFTTPSGVQQVSPGAMRY